MSLEKWNPKNPWIFSKKTAFMQRIADKVRGGCTQYIQGQCKAEKLPFLTQKLRERYPLNRPKITQARRRKAGEGAYHWMGYLEPESELVHWLVLLAPGETPDTTDAWKDPRLDKVKLTGYELVRLTRPGAAAPSWSWRYSRERHDQLRTALVASIRGRRDLDLQQLAHSIWRSPGFAGVREQVKKMRALITSEWKRSRSKAEVMPDLPKQIGFVRRLADVGQPWSDLMKAVKHERVKEEDGNRQDPVPVPRRAGQKAQKDRAGGQGKGV